MVGRDAICLIRLRNVAAAVHAAVSVSFMTRFLFWVTFVKKHLFVSDYVN